MTHNRWKCSRCGRSVGDEVAPVLCPACSSLAFEKVEYVKAPEHPAEDHFYYARENDVLYKRNRRQERHEQ